MSVKGVGLVHTIQRPVEEPKETRHTTAAYVKQHFFLTQIIIIHILAITLHWPTRCKQSPLESHLAKYNKNEKKYIL